MLCGVLPLLVGCPAPCEGPGCESTYDAALMGVLDGASQAAQGELDPLTTWASLQGSGEQGTDWSAALVPGAVLVGIPDSNVVTGFDLSAGGALVFTPGQGRISSGTSGDRLGAAVAALPDQGGDGLSELLIGAPGARRSEASVGDGAVLLYTGQGEGIAEELALDAYTLRLDGVEPAGGLGSVIATCGDIDGDGRADWATAAPRADGAVPLAGRVVLVRSSDVSEVGARIDADQVPTTWFGADIGARAGSALACTDDLTGDGTADLVVGVPFADGDGQARGAVHVLEGGPTMAEGGPGRLLEEAATRTLRGTQDEAWLGHSVATGNLDGDRQADLVAGGPGADDQAGEVRVWATAGRSSDLVSPSSRLTGAAVGDGFGYTVLLADVDGDGLSDLLVGAPFRDPAPDAASSAYDSGTLYAFPGSLGLVGWTPAMSAEDATRSWVRPQQYLRTGQRVFAGDFDQDGVHDLAMVHRSDPG